MNGFRVSITNGNKYITAIYRSTEYCLMRNGDGWGVGIRRMRNGKFDLFSGGSFKHFDTLEEVKAKCKAFGSLDALTAF
jgi:hypothetical protein